MEKIVIIGSPGAGKTTFAQALGDVLDIKVFHLDRYFWRAGWKEHPRAKRILIEKELIKGEDTWIIEGTYLGSSDSRLNSAHTIIFLDISPLQCLRNLLRRHVEWYGRSRCDIPEGCTDRLNLVLILKVLIFPLKGKRDFKEKLRDSSQEKVIWLHSYEDAERFLEKKAQDTLQKCAAQRVPTMQEERLLAEKR